MGIVLHPQILLILKNQILKQLWLGKKPLKRAFKSVNNYNNKSYRNNKIVIAKSYLHLSYATGSSRLFTYIITFNTHDNPMREVLLYLLHR